MTWRILQPDGTIRGGRGPTVSPFAVEVELANGDDIALCRHGLFAAEKVRWTRLQAVVDTRISRLVLPMWVVERLSLPEKDTTEVRYVDSKGAKVNVVMQAHLRLLGRSGSFEAVVGPDQDEARFGAFVLEDLDLLVDPRQEKLLPRDPNTTLTEI
jgi:predicted aspartyl protease